MFKVEITGVDDLKTPWKVAVAGFPGSGKTLFGSTAKSPFFLFFAEHPRYKSIVDRGIPHAKLINEFESGKLKESVMDKMEAVTWYLGFEDHGFDTVVIDTGDELFQQMKEARRAKNNGEFSIGDWGWIADTYRAVIGDLIDLNMNVLVLFHVKTVADEDTLVREIMLQGSVKDEVAGWFDVVGALETFIVTNDDGNEEPRRFLVTRQSRTLPWVKDHTGRLPGKWEITNNFDGDFQRLVELLSTSADSVAAPSEVYKVVEAPTGPTAPPSGVITPQEVKAKKEQKRSELKEEPALPSEPSPEPVERPAKPEPAQEQEPAPESPEPEEQQDLDGAMALVEEELGAEEVFPCAECGEEVGDENLREMSNMKFRKVYCREHFKQRMK